MAKPKKRRAANTFTGRVTEIDVGGSGPNSGQLEFALTPLDGGQPETFIVLMDSEGRVFAAMTSLLIMAYRAAEPVTITYRRMPKETSRCTNVRLPALQIFTPPFPRGSSPRPSRRS
jgi:hypothetical protein